MYNSHLINLKNTLTTYTDNELIHLKRDEITALLTKTMQLCGDYDCQFCTNLKLNTCKDNIPY